MDRSLFSQYPDAPTPPPKLSCCQQLVPPAGVPKRVWDFTHRLCHSRVPFTLIGFAAAVECTDRQAQIAIRNAGQRQWLHLVWPETYMVDPPDQWIGSLARRR